MVVISGMKTFASGASVGAKAPDSITAADGTIFVEYGNNADSTGAGGSSTIVQYDKNGSIEHTYTIAGSVDGLKYNPYTGEIWALQNQDGNSTLTLIDPVTHHVTGPLSFANPSATRGYDDVVFKGDKVFLSYTNPNRRSDAGGIAQWRPSERDIADDDDSDRWGHRLRHGHRQDRGRPAV
jgi:hypothetical protein